MIVDLLPSNLIDGLQEISDASASATNVVRLSITEVPIFDFHIRSAGFLGLATQSKGFEHVRPRRMPSPTIPVSYALAIGPSGRR